MLAASSSVFSKKFFSSRDFAESSLEPMLGSGPYTLDEIEVGKRLVYKLNDNYWGKHLAINKGRNNFKKSDTNIMLTLLRLSKVSKLANILSVLKIHHKSGHKIIIFQLLKRILLKRKLFRMEI